MHSILHLNRLTFFGLVTGFLMLVAFPAHSQRVYTPPTGSAERKAILDLLRVPCEQDLKQKVIFKVDLLKVADNFAAARVTPLQPNGSPINYRKTKYREAVEQDVFDSGGEALLQRKNGTWRLLKWRFGGTDTELIDWIKNYGAPAAIGQFD